MIFRIKSGITLRNNLIANSFKIKSYDDMATDFHEKIFLKYLK